MIKHYCTCCEKPLPPDCDFWFFEGDPCGLSIDADYVEEQHPYCDACLETSKCLTRTQFRAVLNLTEDDDVSVAECTVLFDAYQKGTDLKDIRSALETGTAFERFMR